FRVFLGGGEYTPCFFFFLLFFGLYWLNPPARLILPSKFQPPQSRLHLCPPFLKHRRRQRLLMLRNRRRRQKSQRRQARKRRASVRGYLSSPASPSKEARGQSRKHPRPETAAC